MSSGWWCYSGVADNKALFYQKHLRGWCLSLANDPQNTSQLLVEIRQLKVPNTGTTLVFVAARLFDLTKHRLEFTRSAYQRQTHIPKYLNEKTKQNSIEKQQDGLYASVRTCEALLILLHFT